jgi:hypothetical protein
VWVTETGTETGTEAETVTETGTETVTETGTETGTEAGTGSGMVAVADALDSGAKGATHPKGNFVDLEVSPFKVWVAT